MKILLTGCAGFIGYHLAKKLNDNNNTVLGIDNLNDYYSTKLKIDRLNILKQSANFTYNKADIADKNSITEIFAKFNPEIVVNLAAQPGVRYSITHPFSYISANIQGFVNILELCRSNNTKGLIYASSSSVYGDNKNKPFSINDRANKPISLYGATKRANELMAHSYSHLYGLSTTGLRYFTVYGPWYRPDMAMHIFANKISQNKPIEVYNKGKMYRDFTFINDIVDGTISAINNNYKCEVFNLGNNKSENLMKVINLIEKGLDRKAEIIYKPIQPGDVTETYADIDYSIKKLDYNPKTNINEGVIKFTNWFKEYYDI